MTLPGGRAADRGWSALIAAACLGGSASAVPSEPPPPDPGPPVASPSPPWCSSDDVVDGWDWSLPPAVRPAERSGVAFSGRRPPGFAGNHLVNLVWSWARLEPEEGRYRFDDLAREIERAGRRADGVVLQVRAATARTEIQRDESSTELEGTAPAWLTEGDLVAVMPADLRVNLATPFAVHNLDVKDPEYHRRYLAMVHALGESGIPAMGEIAFVVVHGVSASRGEEAGLTATDEGMIACMEERLEAWAHAFRGAEWKLAWVGDGDEGRLLARAYALGMGQRCGTAERYLMHVSAPKLGQLLGPEGDLLIDESCLPIAERRAFGDENEEYHPDVHVDRFGPVDTWPHRYRESMLRTLQMRRNWLWVESSPWMDPPLLAFVGLELGRTVEDAPDAWCRLRESRIRVAGAERSVRNFERWLIQRDRHGARTVPVLPAVYAGAPDVPEWTGRRTDVATGNDVIGFALDDRFLSGGPHDVAIKVTYADAGNGAWELVVPAAAGGEVTRTVHPGDTGTIRTATFFLEDVAFPGRGEDFDFRIRAMEGDAVVCLVRVIRGS